MTTRPTSDHDRQRLKAATGRSVKRAGGVTSLAAQTRVNEPALSKYAAQQEAGNFMPIDVALDCDMTAGAPVILSSMASIAGYTIEPIRDAPDKLTPQMIGALIRETGDVSACLIDAMADGQLTPVERSQISKEIDEALEALWKVRASLRGE